MMFLAKMKRQLFRSRYRIKNIEKSVNELKESLVKLSSSHQDKFVSILGAMDIPNASFFKYFMEHGMPEAICNLKCNLDEKSCAILDYCLQRISIFPPRSIHNKFKIDKDYLKSLATADEIYFRNMFWDELPGYKKDFNLLRSDCYNPDTFLFHHNLRFRNDKLKRYIANKDFIDGGAFIGDSVLVMTKFYNPNRVYSFEISSVNRLQYRKVMAVNKIPVNKFELVDNGTSSISEQESSLLIEGDEFIKVIDLDSFSQPINLNIGFIKCDVEGAGYDALQGMVKTIQKFRPILNLAMYHTPKEFFEMKPLLEKITKDLSYKITISHLHVDVGDLIEIYLFAYPRELDV